VQGVLAITWWGKALSATPPSSNLSLISVIVIFYYCATRG